MSFRSLKKNSLSEFYYVFNEIEWKEKVFKKNDYIKTQATKPVGLIGRIDKFLVPATGRRDNMGNYMGPPGFILIYQTARRDLWQRRRRLQNDNIQTAQR